MSPPPPSNLIRWSKLCPVSCIRKLKVIPHESDPNLENLKSEAVDAHTQRYMDITKSYYEFHHSFWLNNNLRFEAEKKLFISNNSLNEEEMSIFYRQYTQKYSLEFQNYHWESWKKLFLLLWGEYKFKWYQLKCLLGLRTNHGESPLINFFRIPS